MDPCGPAHITIGAGKDLNNTFLSIEYQLLKSLACRPISLDGAHSPAHSYQRHMKVCHAGGSSRARENCMSRAAHSAQREPPPAADRCLVWVWQVMAATRRGFSAHTLRKSSQSSAPTKQPSLAGSMHSRTLPQVWRHAAGELDWFSGGFAACRHVHQPVAAADPTMKGARPIRRACMCTAGVAPR